MKKLINISFIYFILAMVCGVFYREFTKFFNFTDKQHYLLPIHIY